VAARPAHWQAVWDLSAQEAAGNAAHGPAAFVDTRGSYVATEKQLVALPGAEQSRRGWASAKITRSSAKRAYFDVGVLAAARRFLRPLQHPIHLVEVEIAE
jgi:hypothetical protein